MKISENQRKCLLVMAEIFNHDSDCYYMRHIAKETGLPQDKVRIYVRALARKGLAEYVRGLFNSYEEWKVAGSGYRATRAGYDLVKNDPDFKGDADEDCL